MKRVFIHSMLIVASILIIMVYGESNRARIASAATPTPTPCSFVHLMNRAPSATEIENPPSEEAFSSIHSQNDLAKIAEVTSNSFSGFIWYIDRCNSKNASMESSMNAYQMPGDYVHAYPPTRSWNFFLKPNGVVYQEYRLEAYRRECHTVCGGKVRTLLGDKQPAFDVHMEVYLGYHGNLRHSSFDKINKLHMSNNSNASKKCGMSMSMSNVTIPTSTPSSP